MTSGCILGPGDVVRATLLGGSNPWIFSIDNTGFAQFPDHSTEIKADGMTARQLEEAIEAEMREQGLINPQIAVEILGCRDVYMQNPPPPAVAG